MRERGPRDQSMRRNMTVERHRFDSMKKPGVRSLAELVGVFVASDWLALNTSDLVTYLRTIRVLRSQWVQAGHAR